MENLVKQSNLAGQTTKANAEVRRSERKRRSLEQLQGFDLLPDSALVPQGVVELLEGISSATVWRRVASGDLPAPIRHAGCTRWICGELRAMRAGRVADRK